MSLWAQQKVKRLQQALHEKAKGAPSYRFYTLYDKICRTDVLWAAYRRCRRNGGDPGVDGQTFDQIEAEGVEEWIDALAEALRTKAYEPEPVRRVWIEKGNGKERPLGIPTVRDRVVQTATLIVLAPIFEADLQPEQYAYRSDRSAHDALRHVHRLLQSGHTEVVDADLKGYFDSIPHTELMRSVARRVVDGAVLHLIKMWLEMPVQTSDVRGRCRQSTRNRDVGRQAPQGAPISPLLSNIYMRRFLLSWKKLGCAEELDACIVNYADDFVICCRAKAREADLRMRILLQKLKLTISEEKTRRRSLPEESFDFLGYTIGRCYRSRDGSSYIGTRPSKEVVKRLCRAISEMTARTHTNIPVQALVRDLNRKLTGWAKYFCLGPVQKAYRAVDQHTARRLRRWLRIKHKVGSRGTSRFPDEVLYGEHDLVRLTQRTRSFS